MEITVFQMWLMLFGIAMIFLSGLCWCFCCGTCVGRSLLRNTVLVKFSRDGKDNRQWRHLPQRNDEEEELWHLQTWEEQEEEQEEGGIPSHSINTKGRNRE